MKVVQVCFEKEHGKVYNYYCEYNDVAKGDKVVIDSPYNGYVVAHVYGIDELDTKATKFVVCKVDDTKYKARLEAEAKMAAISKKLESIQKKLAVTAKYEWLRGLSPEAEELLDELKRMQQL